MYEEFGLIYEDKLCLTKRVALIFYQKNKELLCRCGLTDDDLIQLFAMKFLKYKAETFLENCKNDKYWIVLLKREFRLLMLQEYRKGVYHLDLVNIEDESRVKYCEEDKDANNDYGYLMELVKNKETLLWINGKNKREISLTLYGKKDSWTNQKVNKKINEDISNLQEHLGIKITPIKNEVYAAQDRIIELSLQGLTNTEIAERLGKTPRQITCAIYQARKSGKLNREDGVYLKKKAAIIDYIKNNKDATTYMICKLFQTDGATVRRYKKEIGGRNEINKKSS